MLWIHIPESEQWDDENEEFIYTKEQYLQLEHSLISISKWESRWMKPFISSEEKTYDETIDYIRCMTITQNVKDSTYNSLTIENINEINAYIDSPMSATKFYDNSTKKKKVGLKTDNITSELIYYWMIAYNIPSEYQKWHLNRLLSLIEICNSKNQPEKKMSKSEILARNASINEERKKRLNTSG